MNTNDERSPCPGCSAFLQEPYIRCAECGPPPIEMCLHCFAKGFEFKRHQNNHSYHVIKNDFPVFEPTWTAAEEVQLLDALADCGIGNWSDVANQLRTKNKVQCERHYTKCYIENPTQSLTVLEEPDIAYHPSPVVFRVCEDPPRPQDGSTVQQEMAGYMAGRGDFMMEYDNYAEADLREISFENEEQEQFDRDLKMAVLDVYCNKLRERQRRKRIIRKYGLINIKKIQILHRKYDVITPGADSLRAFARLLSPEEYDMFLEALFYEWKLKQDVIRLQNYRQAGITRLAAAHVYDRLKNDRDEHLSKRSLLTDILNHLQDETACQQWLHRQAALDNIAKGVPSVLPAAPRRTAPPLDIASLPGQEKLSEREKELCSLVRLVPESYLEFKNILISECNKHGYLRLAQARTLIKIDVNKTRKLYDFLIQDGSINKEPIT